MPMQRDWLADRDATAEWHRQQAGHLAKYALEEGSATALVYAAIEARTAIERLVFEVSVLATGGQLTDDQLVDAQRQHGIFRLLDDAMENYRRHMKFQNMCQEAGGGGISFPIPDIRRGRRLITELSGYCHCQLDPATTVRDTGVPWFSRGLIVVDDACGFLDPLLQGPRGVLQPDAMPHEVRELFDSFMARETDEASVRTRLDLMQPVLEQRFRQRMG